MKIVSFNVNGLRARLHQLKAVIEKHAPDIIALQETKVHDDQFPRLEVEALGYHVDFLGQKGHYGVALLSKQPPLSVMCGFDSDDDEAQRRLIVGRYDVAGRILTVINGYFPQGGNREHPLKFPAKQRFYADLHQLLGQFDADNDLLAVVGDMNVAPAGADIGIGADNEKRWLKQGKSCFLPEERGWLQRLMDWGLYDSFRGCYPQVTELFSWFDYRSRGFDREPKRGLRIDLILTSDALQQSCRDCGIDYTIRGMEKPSDHCPVWAEFDLD
ncbi:MAG: exodeoxyribonuclease III [Desulfuromonas sp.]|nr:exodeoxyribonuclease III [Desulfuromonas sp.]